MNLLQCWFVPLTGFFSITMLRLVGIGVFRLTLPSKLYENQKYPGDSSDSIFRNIGDFIKRKVLNGNLGNPGDFNKPETCVFQSTFMKQYPTFLVMPGGISLSICRVYDLSNFMMCKCNFLQLKGLLEG